MKRLLLYLCLLGWNGSVSFGQTDDPREAIYNITVTGECVIDCDTHYSKSNIRTSGTGWMASPDGKLVTCDHVGSIRAHLQDIFDRVTKGESKICSVVELRMVFRIENINGLIFSSAFEPEVVVKQVLGGFRYDIVDVEGREYDESKRSFTFHKFGRHDVMVIKVRHGAPLPYLEFSREIADQMEPIHLTAWAARMKNNQPVVVRRFGQATKETLRNGEEVAINMTIIAGDSGAPITTGDNRVINMVFAHQAPEVSDVTYLVPNGAITDVLKDDPLWWRIFQQISWQVRKCWLRNKPRP